MRYLSVCSGIEAATQAWHPLGWDLAAVAEIEPFPCAVLHHRLGAGRPMFMPDPAEPATAKDRRARAAAIKSVARIPEYGAVPNFGDMNRFQEWPDAAVDVLVGGTSCQSFSVAGLRKGMADPRGNLALVYLAVADRYRPRWVVWENVPGVLSSNGGRDFGSFLGGLGQLGYGFAYRVLDAQFVRTRRFLGAVPQRRRRVFVVGYLGDWRRAAAVLFDRESLRGDPPPRREAGKRPAPTLAARTRGGGELGTDFDLDGGLISMAHGQAGAEIAVGHGPTLTCNHEAPIVAHAQRADGFDASEDGTGRGTPIVPVAMPLTAGMSKSAARMPHEQGALIPEGPFAFDMRGREGGAQPEGPHDTANIRAASGGSSRSYVAEPCAHPIAIQELAVSENPNAGPVILAFDCLAAGATGFAVGEVPGALHGGGKSGGRAAVAFSCKDSGADASDDVAPTMRAMGHGDSHANAGGQLAVAFAENSRAELRLCGGDGAVSSQLTTGGGKPGQGLPAIAMPWAVRRLTPRECERLQGFPDDYTLVPVGNKQAADGPRYKALGNSMAVNVMEWLGQRIEMVEQIQ